jgi:hypothetical protein
MTPIKESLVNVPMSNPDGGLPHSLQYQPDPGFLYWLSHFIFFPVFSDSYLASSVFLSPNSGLWASTFTVPASFVLPHVEALIDG